MNNEKMENDNVIFNLNRLPFRDFDSAARLRDLLHRESGHFYQVEQYREDEASEQLPGYVVIRTQRNLIDQLNQAEDRKSGEHDNKVQRLIDEESGHGEVIGKVKNFHPALRTYILYIPLLLAGTLLIVFPQDIWLSVLSALDIRHLPDWVNTGLLINWTRRAGMLILGFNVLNILYSYLSITLIVDHQGVLLKQGIVAQDLINVRFSEIRTIGLKQGIVDRLLNIGVLEFASSGSDGVDIRFYNCVRPKRVKEEIENRIVQSLNRQRD
jgi:hypothetical protein